MSGRLKDGGGILDGGISPLVYALNAAGIPTVPTWDWTQAVAWVQAVDQSGAETPLQFVTLTVSTDWDAPGGNEDDLSHIMGAFESAFDAAPVRRLRYWGPGADTTSQNVLVVGGALIALSAGWTLV